MDSFVAPIAQIEHRVNEIDDQIYTTRIGDTHAFMLNIEAVRKNILSLISLLSSKIDVLGAYTNHRSGEGASGSGSGSDCGGEDEDEDAGPGDDIHLYIDDVQDHVVTMLSSLHHFESLVSRAQKNCVAQLEVDNVVVRRRVERYIVRITILTLILSFLNLISGLFSTNVNANVSIYADNNLISWLTIVSCYVVVALFLVLLARRSGWF